MHLPAVHGVVLLMTLACLWETSEGAAAAIITWDKPPRYLGCICSTTSLDLAVRDKPCGKTVRNLVHDRRCVRFTGDMERQSCALDGGSERVDYFPVYVGGKTYWVDAPHIKPADWNACQANDEDDLPWNPPTKCPGWPYCVQFEPVPAKPTVPSPPPCVGDCKNSSADQSSADQSKEGDNHDDGPKSKPATRRPKVRKIDVNDLVVGMCLCTKTSGYIASLTACKIARLGLNKNECFTYEGKTKSCKDAAGKTYDHILVSALDGVYVRTSDVSEAHESLCETGPTPAPATSPPVKPLPTWHAEGSIAKPKCSGPNCQKEKKESESDGKVYYPPRFGCQ